MSNFLHQMVNVFVYRSEVQCIPGCLINCILTMALMISAKCITLEAFYCYNGLCVSVFYVIYFEVLLCFDCLYYIQWLSWISAIRRPWVSSGYSKHVFMEAHTTSFLSCQWAVMEGCIVCITFSKFVVLPTGVELCTTTTITTSIPSTTVWHSGALAGNIIDNLVVFYILWIELHTSELTNNGISSEMSKCLSILLQRQIT